MQYKGLLAGLKWNCVFSTRDINQSKLGLQTLHLGDRITYINVYVNQNLQNPTNP